MENAGNNLDLEDSKFRPARVVKGFGACPVGMVAGFRKPGSSAAVAPSTRAARPPEHAWGGSHMFRARLLVTKWGIFTLEQTLLLAFRGSCHLDLSFSQTFYP